MAGINLDVSGLKVLLEPVSAQTFSLTVPSAVPAVVEVLATGPQGPAGANGDGTAYYGQVASQTSQTFTGLSENVYVPMALSTFTLGDVFGFEADGFGLRNVSGAAQLVWAIGTVDSSTGNNRTTGLRLAVDGVGIPLSVCTATTGTQNFAKLMTQFLVEVPDGQTVSLQVANVAGGQDVTVERAKLVLATPGRQGEQGVAGVPGEQGPPGPAGVVQADAPITYDADSQTVGIDPSGYVASVNGATGTAVLDTDDVSEGTVNLYNRVPTGGVSGQVLAKVSATDYDLTWQQPGHPLPPPTVGEYLVPTSFGGVANTGFNNNEAQATPVYVMRSVTVDQINCIVTVVASSASEGRLGIYASDAAGKPSTLIVDAGVYDATTSGVKSITLSPAVTLPQGVVFLVHVQQGAAFQGRRGGFRTLPFRPTTAANSLDALAPLWGYRQSGVTGALPSTWTGAATEFAPLIMSCRIASVL
jgi:hypothetical protein